MPRKGPGGQAIGRKIPLIASTSGFMSRKRVKLLRGKSLKGLGKAKAPF